MRGRFAVVMLIVGALAMSGCLGNSVSVSKSGGGTLNEEKSLNCGASGSISSSFSGGSSVRVRVTDGDSNTIYDKGGTTGGWEGGGQSLSGVPGKWTMKVTGSYGGSVQVTLKC